MSETAPTANYRQPVAGVTNDANLTPTSLRVDPTSKRLLVDPGTSGGGSSATDDGAFTVGSDSGTPAMGIYQASEDSVDDGDVGVLGMTADRHLKISIEDDNVGIGGGTQYTEDAAAAANPVGNMNMAVRADSLAAVTNADGDNIALRATNKGEVYTKDADAAALLTTIDTDTSGMATSLAILDDWDESDRAKVNLIASQAGITGGAGAVAANTPRITLASDDPAVVSLGVLDDWDNGASDGASVSGDVAHDSADAGEPVKMGAKAVDLGATPTAVAANDRTNLYSSRAGILFTLGGHPNTLNASIQVTDADGAQTDTAIITVSAGTAIVVTAIEIAADNANTADVSVRVGFGTANTPAADAAGLVAFHPGAPAGGGLVKGNGSGIIGIGASNEDLRVTCEDPTGGSIDINVTYHTISIG